MNEYWRIGRDGKWNAGDNWIGGVPASGDTAYLTAAGHYTVTLATAATLDKLVIVGAGLVETSKGSFAISEIDVTQGRLELDASNPGMTGRVSADDSLFTIGASTAFGSATLALDDGSELLATKTATLSNNIGFIGDDRIAAAQGATLTLTGFLFTDDAMTFGAAGMTGDIVLAGSFGMTHEVAIDSGVVSLGVNGLDMLDLTVAAGAVFDLNGFSTEVSGALHNLGTIRNSGALATLDLEGVGSGTAISGNLLLASQSGGQASYSGDVSFIEQGGISLTNSGKLELSGSFSVAATGSVAIGQSSVLHLSGPVNIGCNIDLEGGTLIVSGSGVIAAALGGSQGQFVFDGDGQFELDGPGSSTLIGKNEGAGTLVVTQPNTFAQFIAAGGTTIFTSSTSFGSGTDISASAGSLLRWTSSGTVGADISAGEATFAIAHGDVLTLSGAFSGTRLTLGTAADDGTFILDTTSADFGGLDLAFGKVKLGKDYQLTDASRITIEAGATLDLSGHSAELHGLTLDGSVTSTHGKGQLELYNAFVSGIIGGSVSVDIITESGDNPNPITVFASNQTYTGTTTILNGATLLLGDGGAAGSVKSASIVLQLGDLDFDRSDTFTLSNTLSGQGFLFQEGSGTTILSADNSGFRGLIEVDAGILSVAGGQNLGASNLFLVGGILSIGGATPFGADVINFAGGEILLRANTVLGDANLDYSGNGTIAAAHGVTVMVTDAVAVEASGTLIFGEGANNGVIVLAPTSGSFNGGGVTFDVRAHTGTLLLGNFLGQKEVASAAHVLIDKHATLDVNGQGIFLPSLTGSGTITSSGGFAGITVVDGSFSGTITGPVVIDTLRALTLSGKGSFSSFSIEGGATGTISGHASEGVAMEGDPNATLVLASSAKFTGAIDGFGSGDAVDLKAVAFSGATETYDSATGRLTVTNGSHSVVLTFSGSYAASDFRLADDGSGHAGVHYAGQQASVAAGTLNEVFSPGVFGETPTQSVVSHHDWFGTDDLHLSGAIV